MPSSALIKLHSFHRGLQQAVVEGIKHFSAQASPAISAYSQRFQASLPAASRETTLESILESGKKSDLLLFGDFHSLPQSQRSFLRLIEENVRLKRPVCVALEIFDAVHQPLIDEYAAGRLPEEYFLKRIDYHNKWGFPWENYRPIVEFCVKNKIPMFGINCQLEAGNRLAKRDSFAASVLDRIHDEQPDRLCLCLIGEYHLADDHLMKHLEKSLRVTRVVNNVDDYSLQVSDRGMVSEHFLGLSEDFYCILNTMPWIKWQSLAMWEESHGSQHDDGEAYTEHHYDFEYQLLFILRAINSLLNLGISSHELSKFDIYLQPDSGTLKHIKSKLGLKRNEMRQLEKRAVTDGYHYVRKTIVLADASLEPLIEAAGCYIRDILCAKGSDREKFASRIGHQIAATLTALLMNPRQNYPTIEKIEEICQTLRRKRLIGEARTRRDVYRQVLSVYDELRSSDGESLPGILDQKDKDYDGRISQVLGQVIGQEIFRSFLNENESAFLTGMKKAMAGSLSDQLALIPSIPALRSAS